MVSKFNVRAIGACIPVSAGTKASREVSITLQAETEKLVLMIPEAAASELMNKLQGLNLPPSGLSPFMKLS
jgi:hypothetical protein